MAITISGVEARVRWGYRPAATLRAWTLTSEAGVRCLTGTVVQKDTFAVSQRPLTLVMSNLTLPITELQIEGASCRAVLGPGDSHVQMPICPA